MSVGGAIVAFALGAIFSLGTSWVLVSRLERLGERFGLSEALLGLLAALAADMPEVTAAITALARHQRAVGTGVVLGSNVFNVAVLLGLGAVVAGWIGIHRRVVALGGSVALWVAIVSVLALTGVVAAYVGLVLVLVALVPYVILLGDGARIFRRARLPRRWVEWLAAAVAEEELELGAAIRPRRGSLRDGLLAAGALVVVVVASVTMERAATDLGSHYNVAGIVVGGLVLAAVTSLPNAVAAVYLAAKGRGAATLSTALNSNTLNVLVGLLIPGVAVGLASPSGQTSLTAGYYAGMTVLALVLSYADGGLRRRSGWLIIAAYGAFIGSILATVRIAG